MAEWVQNNPPSDLRPRCTACKNVFPVRTEYCPNCGETMYNGTNDPLRGPWAMEIRRLKILAAIKVLEDELDHTLHHLMERGKDPEYYTELAQFATALEMGIAALRKDAES